MRILGAILLICGVCIAAFYFLINVFADIPVWIKIAIAVGGTGLLLLLISIIRERCGASEDEDLKGVER